MKWNSTGEKNIGLDYTNSLQKIEISDSDKNRQINKFILILE